jgi:DNA helicase II / ATP-dependent DNA helicase PcrA
MKNSRDRGGSMLPFLDQLNSNQFRAVTAPEGHLLINAAAGTGKTSTLAARIIYLQIEKGIEPSQMLALSFSRSARQGLLDKLEKYRQAAGTGSPIETLTFHGLAFRILRVAAGLGETWLKPGFKIIDSNVGIFTRKAKSFFKDVEQKQDMENLYSKAIDSIRQGHHELNQVYLAADELPSGKKIRIEVEHSIKVSVSSDDIKKVWKSYQTYLKRTNQIDYPGLISEAINVLQQQDCATAKRIQLGLKYLFIDEYQDTSKAQEQLAFLLAGRQMYINVVGDNEQTVYTFNGSDVSNILNFYDRVKAKGMKVLEPINLVENYRSSGNILSLANRMVEKGRSLYKKELVPAVNAADEVKGYQFANNKVQLVRVPRISKAAEFTVKEIQKLVKEENIQYSEIAVLIRKDSEFSPQGTEVKTILEKHGIPVGLMKRETQDNKKLYEVTEEFCQYHYNEPLSDLIASLKIGQYKDELQKIEPEEIVYILNEAMNSGAAFAYDALDFLIDSGSQESLTEGEDGVQIRTIHSAKGLEFRIVFVLFVGDKSFPHGAKPDIEEERRLFYVSVTRAQERLYILGKNGIHGPDFFGECSGEGTNLIDYFAIGNGQRQDQELTAEVDKVKKALKDEEEQQRARLMALFEDDDF